MASAPSWPQVKPWGFGDKSWQLENLVFLIQAQSHTGFLESLQPLEVQYLFTYANSDYARWADADPLHFRLIATYGTSRVYAVNL